MRRTVWAFLVFGAHLINPLSVHAQFPTGIWKVNGNGAKGDLVIKSIDQLGNFTGTIYGDKITGVYDAKTKCLSFLRTYETGSQAWKGYVFDGKANNYTIAGTFQSFAFGRDVRRLDAGWYGTMPTKE